MPPKTNEELKNQTQLNAVAYSPEIIAVRAVLAKHLNEWNGALIRDLATLLTEKDKQKEEAVAEERERLLKMFDEFNDEIEFEEMAQMVRRFIQALTQPIN